MECQLFNGYTCNIIFNKQANIYSSGTKCYFSNASGNHAGDILFNSRVVLPDAIKDTSYTFNGLSNFNSVVSLPNNAEICTGMFTQSDKFNRPITIPNKVINCDMMFRLCNNYNSPVTFGKNIQNCVYMFENSSKFGQSVTLGQNVQNCRGMFRYTNVSTVAQLPASVTDCADMYSHCNSLVHADNVVIPANTLNADTMFAGCDNLLSAQVYITTSRDIYGGDISGMFTYCNKVVAHISYPNETPAFTDARVNSGGNASSSTGLAGITGQQATTNADFNFKHLGTTITFRDTGTTWTLVKDSYNEYSQSQHIWQTYYFSHFKL